MNPAAAFFFIVLALQAVFTVATVWLVGRRYPARLRVYRFVAPAALPLLLFALVAYSFLESFAELRAQAGIPFEPVLLAPLGRIFLAYAVLWLFGVILANLVIRLTRR
jgi:hypothetical protein